MPHQTVESDSSASGSTAPGSTASGATAPARGPRRRVPVKLLAVVAAVAVAVPLGVQAAGALADLASPEQRIIDRSPAPLLLALADLQEYHAATGTFQAVVDLERDTPYLPAVISGERTTLLATGSVDAVVDFGGLGPEAVRPSADRRSVTIALPAPRLAPATLDPSQTRVLDRDRGVAERIGGLFADDPVDDTELYQLAAQRVDEAARASDLLARAETGTRDTLATLAGSLGYEQVVVTFDAPLTAPE